MIDIKILRQESERIKKAANDKGYTVDIDLVLELDERRRKLQRKADELRAQRNEIAAQMKGDKLEPSLVEKGKNLKTELAALEADLSLTDEEFLLHFKKIPNLPTDDVVLGKSEAENIVAKTWATNRSLILPLKTMRRLPKPKAGSTKSAARKWLARDLYI